MEITLSKITSSYVKNPQKNHVSFKSISPEVEKELANVDIFMNECTPDKIKIDDSDTQWSHKYDEFETHRGQLSSDREFHSYYNSLQEKTKNKQIQKLITQYSTHEDNKKELEELLSLGLKNDDEEVINNAKLIQSNLNRNDTDFKVLKSISNCLKGFFMRISASFKPLAFTSSDKNSGI